MYHAHWWPSGLLIIVLLGTSSCHSNHTPYDKLWRSSFSSHDLLSDPVDTDSSQHPRSSSAQDLINRPAREASMDITAVGPAPPLQPIPRLPPLPVTTHLSVFTYLSHQGEVTTDQFTSEALPITPDRPVLFTDPDQHGIGLDFDMGLTDPNLPLTGTAEWPLNLQALCLCPDPTGLQTTTDALARLDFTTGRFRLSAQFKGPVLQSAGIDLPLNRPSLMERQSQQATAEINLSTRPPIQLDGDLLLYFSGRNAKHIGGQFTSASPQLSLSDILFVMQFVNHPKSP